MRYGDEEYISVAEAAAQWGVQARAVQAWCGAGRIEGARRLGRAWLIPARAARPADRREKRPEAAPSPQVAEISPASRLVVCPGPGEEPPDCSGAEDRRLLLNAELAKLRGDSRRALELAGGIGRESPWHVGAQLCIFGAAGARGDCLRVFAALRELEALRAASDLDGASRARVETALAVAAASLYAREALPDWLIRGDFSRTPGDCLPMALYAWLKHLHGAGETRQMLGAALAALALARNGTAVHIYLELMAVVALAALNRKDEAREHASRAARLAMPRGFLAPFAEHVASAFGVIEEVFRTEWPAGLSRLKTEHDALWRGWAETHNAILNRRLELRLTARERQVALMLIDSRANGEIAAQLGISMTGVKQHVRNILAKLGARNRRDIVQFAHWAL